MNDRFVFLFLRAKKNDYRSATQKSCQERPRCGNQSNKIAELKK